MKKLASVIRILLVIIAVLFCIFEIFKTPITILFFVNLINGYIILITLTNIIKTF